MDRLPVFIIEWRWYETSKRWAVSGLSWSEAEGRYLKVVHEFADSTEEIDARSGSEMVTDLCRWLERRQPELPF